MVEPESHPIRKFFTALAVGATLFGLGLALGSKWGLLLIALSVLYLAWELFTSGPIRRNVPGMLSFLFAVMALSIVIALNKGNLDRYFKPRSLPTDKNPSTVPLPTSASPASAPPSSQPQLPEQNPAVLLQCQDRALPIEWNEQKLYFLPVYLPLNPPKTGPPLRGLASNEFGSARPWMWGTDHRGDFVSQCEFINYGEIPIVSLSAKFRLTFYKALNDKAKNEMRAGEVVAERDYDAVVPRAIDGHSGKFAFLINNQVAQYTQITEPSTATVRFLGSKSQQEITLDHSRPSGPMQDILLAPPRDLFQYAEPVGQAGQCYLRTAGYFPMPFRNDVVLPTMLANPTETPVDNVHMTIIKLIYKNDTDSEPSLVEGQPEELEIGTCRAKLYLGINNFNFSPGNHDRLVYRITIFTRYETWTEMVKLWKGTKKNGGQPSYCEEVTVLRGGNEQMVHFRDDDCD